MNKSLSLFLIGLCLGVLCFGFFFIGANYVCERSGGELTKWECSQLIDVGYCVHQGDRYRVDATSKLNWSGL